MNVIFSNLDLILAALAILITVAVLARRGQIGLIRELVLSLHHQRRERVRRENRTDQKVRRNRENLLDAPDRVEAAHLERHRFRPH